MTASEPRPAANRAARKRGDDAAPSDATQIFAALLTVAAAFIAYAPALRNGFVWDDPLILEQLRAIHGFGDLIVMPPQIPRFYYRPLIFVSYLLDRALGGETPFWFHFSVVAMHALNSFLVFRLAMKLFRDDVVLATVSGLLFAVLPTHVESVAWMAGRSDVVVCTFLLLTANLAMRRDADWTAWLGGLTLFGALLSKESGVAGLVLVPVLDWLSTRRFYWGRYVPLVFATVAYFLLRQGSVGSVVGGTPAAAPANQISTDLLYAAGFYLARSVAPFGVSPYIPAVETSAIYLVAALLIPLVVIALTYRAWPRSRWPFAFLLAWFVVTLAPSFTVILRTSASAPLADRYLYVPSVATCVLAAWAIGVVARRWRLGAWWAVGLASPLLLVFGIATATNARVWTDNLSFWSEVAADYPDNALAQREVGSALLAKGQLGDAETHLKRSLTLPLTEANRVMAYSQLGLVYRRQSRFSDAATAFDSALAIAPHPNLFHNLGMTLMAKAEFDQKQGDSVSVARDVKDARKAFEAALSMKSPQGQSSFLEQWNPAKTHALLGQVLISLNERAAAREHLETALRLEPTGPAADITRRQLSKIAP